MERPSIPYRPYAATSGWNAIARHVPTRARTALQADATAEHVVVGAGFAGLAAARRLAESYPDQRVVLLDADAPAENSSGRNSGFMIDLPYAKIDSRVAARQADWQIEILGAGKRLLEDTVARHGIDCGWMEAGHYKVATTEFGAQQLSALERTLQDKGVAYRRLAAADILAELGTAHYRAALWLKRCTLVQPAELVHGLVDSLPENVFAYFNAPVTRIAGTGPYRLHAGGHVVTASNLLLCVNTALPDFGHARYRQLAMYTYAGMSRKLDEREAAAFGQDSDWGITPVERLEATSRKIGGTRFMLRAGFSYKSELAPDQVRELLTARLLARHPDLPSNLFEHVWGGAVSLTRNGDPIFRKLGKGLVALSGCNASGILKMTAMGTLLADLLTDKPSALLTRTLEFCRPTFIPPDPLRRLGVNMNLHRFHRQLRETSTTTS